MKNDTFKVFFEDVPACAKLECRQLSATRHSLNVFAAALEHRRDIGDVQRLFCV